MRRSNDLYVGSEYLNIEGREIKHAALIKLFANVNISKVSDKPINLIGLDLETNHKTAELKLLGFYNGKYAYYTKDFLDTLLIWVKHAARNEAALAYWNRLDPFVLYKQFLYRLEGDTPDDSEIRISLKRFAKKGGTWSKKDGCWIDTPVVEVEMGETYFGIKNVIRSSVQFFYRKKGSKFLNTVWAYDIAQLFKDGLETTASTRLPWYSKVAKEAHLVDWERFKTDMTYRDLVLKSNHFDAKAVRELGMIIQEEFRHAFKMYPKSIVSQGTLARSAVVAVLHEIYKGDQKKIVKEVQSIGMLSHIDNWCEQIGEDELKDFLAMTFEAYSGGQIEAYMYGYSPLAYAADLTQAYPYIISQLKDLRGAKLTFGEGEPPHIKNSYCFIRGEVDIPLGVDYHTLTVKHPFHKGTNIRPVGQFKASYIIEERDHLIALGAKFTNEKWYNIETKGKLSPIAIATQKFIDLREELRPEGKDFMPKSAAASMYGLTFEAVDTWVEQLVESEEIEKVYDNYYKDILGRYLKRINLSAIKSQLTPNVYARWHNPNTRMTADKVAQELETYGVYLYNQTEAGIIEEMDTAYTLKPTVQKHTFKELDILRDGYRAGEFLNSVYATYITGLTRLQVAKAAQTIKDKGGKVILIMTDSVHFEGTPDMIPAEMVRDPKVAGYFEKPVLIKDFVCLGSGRYGYMKYDAKKKTWETLVAKKRGLNITDIHDEEGAVIDEEFNWREALEVMKKTGTTEIEVKVRSLISVGVVLHNKKYTWRDLGLVTEDTRLVDAIAGKAKRIYDEIDDPSILAEGLLDTEPIHLSYGMLGKSEINDQTLPQLRELMMKRPFNIAKKKRRQQQLEANSRYKEKNYDKIKQHMRENYRRLKDLGYTTVEAKKMMGKSDEKLNEVLRRDGKI